MAQKTKARTPKSMKPGAKPPPQRAPGEPDPLAGHTLARANTDAGRAEHEAQLAAEGRLAEGHIAVGYRDPEAERIARETQQGERSPNPRGSVEDLTHDMAQRTDAVERHHAGESVEAWESPDPMREVAQRHRRAGFRQRFLSLDSIQRKGMRGWSFVETDSGKARVGRMVLAEMPEDKARRRNAYFLEQSKVQVRDMIETGQATIEAAARTANSEQGGKRIFAALKPGERMGESSMASSEAEPGYAVTGEEQTVGVHMTRGSQTAER